MSYAPENVLEYMTQDQFDELASSPGRPLVPVDREEAEQEESDSDGDHSVSSGSAVEIQPKLEEAEEVKPIVKPARISRPRASLSPRAQSERKFFNELWAQLKPLKGDPDFFDSFFFSRLM